MADFNVDLAAPNASGAKVISPVQDARTNFPNPWAAFALGVGEALMKGNAEAKKQEKEAFKQGIVGEFVRSQTAIADSIMQGSDSGKAGVLARANFSKYAAAYPELVEDFSKSNKSLFEFTELGEAKDTAQMFKDARKETIGSMVKSGYVVDDTMPKAVVDSQIQAFQITRRAEAEFDSLAKRRQEARSMAAEDRTAFEFKAKQDAVTLLTSIGDAHLDSSFKTTQAIVEEAKRTGNVDEGRAKLIQSFSGIERSLVAAAAHNPSMADSYKKLFDEVKQFGLDSLDGKYQASAAENKWKEMQARIMLTTTSSPENKAIFGASKLFGGTIPATYTDINSAGRNLIGNLAHTFSLNSPTIVGMPKEEGAMYDLVKSNVSAIEAGKTPDAEGTKVQLGNMVNNTLHQVGQAASRGLKPEQLSASFNFIASPEYAKLISYGKIDKEAAQSANKVFQLVYERDVSKAITAKMDEPFDRTVAREKQETYGQLVDFKWNGSGVSAEMVPTGTGKNWLNRTEAQNRDVFVSQMSAATKAMNQLIKAGAHMEGHTDYAKYWESNKHNILPNYYPDPARLKPGQVVNGYKYVGGNYKAQSNWVKEASAE